MTEPTIFELSQPGRSSWQLRTTGMPEWDVDELVPAEHRRAEFEHGRRRSGRRLAGHGLRSARQNDAARTERAYLGVAHVPGMYLAVHAELAYAPRDQLRVLRTEVDDQDPVRMDIGRRRDRVERRHG